MEYFRGSGDYDGECDLVLCYDDDRLVGEAIYTNKCTSRGKVALVVQLVVHRDYRRQGIGSALLYSIWGFSDYYAWGIVTSNPCTVKTLEKATCRQCSASEIIQNKHFLSREVLANIRFLDETRDRWVVNRTENSVESRIRTGFATERMGRSDALMEIESRLGRLGPQDEWMAFVFNSQSITSDVWLRQMLDESNIIVRDAYMRMDMKNQKWAGRATEEVQEILKMVSLPRSAAICDFGAGTGRHLTAFRQLGFDNVMGIDFANRTDDNLVIAGDCRSWKGERLFDLALCLYDVIGSFRSLEDNRSILENIFSNLKSGGYAVVSVMNLDFKGMDCAGDAGSRPDELYANLRKLSPSTNMSGTGEVFDGKFALVDRKSGLVYRKEQFDGDDNRLRRELVVVDMRFTRQSIVELCRLAGFEVKMSRYVRAGFVKPRAFQRLFASRWGKEILLLLAKPYC
jgi:GNAT superfamily N-acetyltransferase/SAM-dependent methyltransferase